MGIRGREARLGLKFWGLNLAFPLGSWQRRETAYQLVGGLSPFFCPPIDEFIISRERHFGTTWSRGKKGGVPGARFGGWRAAAPGCAIKKKRPPTIW